MADSHEYETNYHNYLLIEKYEEFSIMKGNNVDFYMIKEFPALCLSTVEVAKKCIDVYFEHLKK